MIGKAGSFFKNPTVTPEQCADIIQREPKIVHYHLDDGSVKLAAGWLIDACGWKGKTIGNAGVYERQALVLVNRGGTANPVTGGEVMTLAKAIQTSVYERFGILLELEPVVVEAWPGSERPIRGPWCRPCAGWYCGIRAPQLGRWPLPRSASCSASCL